MTTAASPIRYQRSVAIEVARVICGILKPCCAKLIVAGSLRRRCGEVGDVDIVYVPNVVPIKDAGDLFGKEILQNAVDVALDIAIKEGLIEKRRNEDGELTWGEQIKHASFVAGMIPVDFFAADHDNWFNQIVCRTGPMESNIRVAKAAREIGWAWAPLSAGFTRPSQEKGGGYVDVKVCRSEQEVFEFAGLPYLQPEERK